MFKKIKNILLMFVMLFSFFVFVDFVDAAALLDDNGNTEYTNNCKEDGNCELNDIIVVLIRTSEIILGVIGSLTLLAFVIGGTFILVSGGNNEMVTKGKKIIIGAVIGIVIVFMSYGIIQFAMKAMGIDNWDSRTNWSPDGNNQEIENANFTGSAGG